MKQDNATVKAQSYRPSHTLFTSKHRQQHRYVLADGNVAIILLKVCVVIWHSPLSRKNPATDASSKSAIAHVDANCSTSCCTRWNTFSRFPQHQGVTHWEGEISEGGNGAVLSGLALSTLAIWCRLVRSRDFSAPVRLVDVINCAKFYRNRLRGLDSVRGRSLTIPKCDIAVSTAWN